MLTSKHNHKVKTGGYVMTTLKGGYFHNMGFKRWVSTLFQIERSEPALDGVVLYHETLESEPKAPKKTATARTSKVGVNTAKPRAKSGVSRTTRKAAAKTTKTTTKKTTKKTVKTTAKKATGK